MRCTQLYLGLAAAGLVACAVPIPALARADAAPAQADDVAADAGAAAAPESRLESIVVTGSRIPRAEIEGPAPVLTITAEDIRDKGLATAYDIVRSLTQFTGSVQTQQFQGFTPGAQTVDLRGLGPNYTLVLLNGRRMADFPIAYNAQSNVTDIANIPVSMIERVEVLTGSASAVYGSDAVSGVVNFILKKKADGTTLSYRVGDSADGGGFSQRLQLTSGGSVGALDALFGVELYKQDPIFQYQRDFQDSNADDPTLHGAPIAARTFLRWNPATQRYIDPGESACAALSALDDGTVARQYRPNRGYYCGTNEAKYGTIQDARRNAVGYAALTYHLDDATRLYADLQFAATRAEYGGGPNFWGYTGSPDNTFINAATGTYEAWQRIFTKEEVGGLDAIQDYNHDHTRSIDLGIEGELGGWHYDAGYAASRYQMVQAHRAILADAADAFFLGAPQGVDPDSGYTIFNPDLTRLYTPLTPADYASISRYTPIQAHTRAETFTLSVDNSGLFDLPAGPVGAAGVLEYGTQAYAMDIDPDVTANRYFGWTGTGGSGSRSRYAGGVELRIPVLSSVNLTPAVRYDSYSYAGHDEGKATHSLGLEWRPFDTLLLRGSAATSFRAPDLHYVFAGDSGAYYTLTDYYLCRTRQPGTPYGQCDFGQVSVKATRHGNRDLGDETGKSFTYGLVWSPLAGLDLGLDYYRIQLKDVVTDRNLDEILRTEADCRLGHTESGEARDPNSPTCQQAFALVQRYPTGAPVNPEQISGALTYPINAASLRQSGIDANLSYAWETARFGRFRLRLDYTGVLDYTYRQFPGDADIDVRDDLNNDNLRSRVSGSLAWQFGRFDATVFGQRWGSLSKYDASGRYGPSMRYNLSLGWRLDARSQLAFTVDNVFDSPPHRDSTHGAYPYYDYFQFDPIGRMYYLEYRVRFGGAD